MYGFEYSSFKSKIRICLITFLTFYQLVISSILNWCIMISQLLLSGWMPSKMTLHLNSLFLL